MRWRDLQLTKRNEIFEAFVRDRNWGSRSKRAYSDNVDGNLKEIAKKTLFEAE